MSQGRDYTILENAIKLVQGVDFTNECSIRFHYAKQKVGGRVMLLAVAYEYSDGTEVHRVGEFTDAGVIAPDNLVVKMLRSEIINPSIPMFDLLMKNVYEIPGAFQLQKEGFRLELLYYDDSTGEPVNILQNASNSRGK